MQSHQQHHKTLLHELSSLVCLVYLHYNSPRFQFHKQSSFYCTGQSKKKYLSKLQSLNYLISLKACNYHKALHVFVMGAQIKAMMLTDRQNLNQSQNDQNISLTTFTTITHSHMPISWHINISIAFSQCVDYFLSARQVTMLDGSPYYMQATNTRTSEHF